jgi:hypothetical protein
MSECRARLWVRVPDRPGALGLVASRIGALKADIVGIEVLEHGDGFAHDELLVVLPDEALVPALRREIAEVDGAALDSVTIVDEFTHRRADDLAAAYDLVAAESVDELATTLRRRLLTLLRADWCTIATPQGTVGAERPDLLPGAAAYDVALAPTITATVARDRPLTAAEHAVIAGYGRLVELLAARLGTTV